MQQQHGQFDQERRLLESELEAVRNRAVEMAEMLDQQKRQATEQQAQWADELKRMRRLMEEMSGRMATAQPAPAVERPMPMQQPAAPQQPVTSQQPVAVAEPSDEDPVLDSVMAQFEMLQRDLARRRAAGEKR